MKIDEMFHRFFRADDVNEPMTLEIMQVIMERFNGVDKPVVCFADTHLGLTLNRTTSEQIAAITGEDDTDRWAGRKITLVRDTAIFNGKPTACIRVRKPTQATPSPRLVLKRKDATSQNS